MLILLLMILWFTLEDKTPEAMMFCTTKIDAECYLEPEVFVFFFSF